MTGSPRSRWPRIREISLFCSGLLGILYETVWKDAPDPSLLLIFGAMLGLPLMLRKDEGG